jgi:hypothetical protein
VDIARGVARKRHRSVTVPGTAASMSASSVSTAPNCKRYHPGAIQPTWTRELVLAAMLDWLNRHGDAPVVV